MGKSRKQKEKTEFAVSDETERETRVIKSRSNGTNMPIKKKGISKRIKKKEMLTRSSVEMSEYFNSASQENDKLLENRKQKSSSSLNLSIASKIRKMKNEDTLADSDSSSEFESVEVSYKLPKLPVAKVTDKKSNMHKGRSVPHSETSENMDSCHIKEETRDRKSKKKRKCTSKESRSDIIPSKILKMDKNNSNVRTEKLLPVKMPKKKVVKIKPKSENEEKHMEKIFSKETEDSKLTQNKSGEEIKKRGSSIKKDLVECFSSTGSNGRKKDVEKKKNSRKNIKIKNEVNEDKTVILRTNKKVKNKVSEDKIVSPKTLDHSDVRAVLLHMEGAGLSSQLPSICQPSTSKGFDNDSSDEDEMMSDESDDSDAGHKDVDLSDDVSDDTEEEWEDVADHHGNSPSKSQIPDKPVEITLDAPVIYKKRKKKDFDIQAYFRRQMNKFRREVALDIHKVHLMCLLARGLYLNNICQDETTRAQIFSIVTITRELTLPPLKCCTEDHVSKIISWARREFPVNGGNSDDPHGQNVPQRFQSCLQSGSAASQLELTLICVVLLRQLGLLTRLLMSLQPLPLKYAPKKESQQTGTNKSNKTMSKKLKVKETTGNNGRQKSKKGAVKTKQTKVETCREKKKEEVNGKKTSRSCSKRLSKDAYKDCDDGDGSGNELYHPEIEDKNLSCGKISSKKGAQQSNGKGQAPSEENVSDSDFEEESLTQTQTRQKPPASKNRQVSMESGKSVKKKTRTDINEWVEVYLEKQEKWICFDIHTGEVGKPYNIESMATQPVCYVIGVDNDGSVKDVTARYASQWLTNTRKLRVDGDWWEETLSPYRCADGQKDTWENKDLEGNLLQRPLPTTVSAFKNHPLYALKRHLLKFEALYPDTAVPLGYIRGEPVFARECVHTLHSRENWLKEGRSVRISEEPFKFVKSRPKWNRPKDDPEAKDLELFGPWQTEVYIPPPAVDGKVPRNAHGNVEMFLPSMLPGGTVHLQIPGLNKVAKKLDIDCAPAMVGWDHHCGFSHPLMDGWIVCEEHKDILLAAWDEEQEIIKEKEAEKREKRVYENWRRLIRGLLIKERLKKRFDLETPKSSTENSKMPTSEENEKEKTTDYEHAWPQNRLTDDQHTLGQMEKI